MKPLVVVTDETAAVSDLHEKTPRQFPESFERLIGILRDLHWFEHQYPLVKLDVCIFVFNCFIYVENS